MNVLNYYYLEGMAGELSHLEEEDEFQIPSQTSPFDNIAIPLFRCGSFQELNPIDITCDDASPSDVASKCEFPIKQEQEQHTNAPHSPSCSFLCLRYSV